MLLAPAPAQGTAMRATSCALLAFYLLCCVGALGLIHVSEHQLLGLQPDPLAHAFAWLLALPWSLLTLLPIAGSPTVAYGLTIAGMLLNLALGVVWVARWKAG
jgi:hypothetical protein